MKQTAVLFLQEALSIHFTYEQKMQFIGLFNQALDMEKQQIIDACNLQRNDYKGMPTYNKSGEQYYNKTYKSKQDEI